MTSTQLVTTIFKRLFGTHPDAEHLRETLLGYADSASPRVQLAILKLSEGDTERLLHFIEAARIDYRDVLAWAEYPEQMRSGNTRDNTSLEEYEAMLRRDRSQYDAWLDGFDHPDSKD